MLIKEKQIRHVLLHHLRTDKGLISCCMKNQKATLLVAFGSIPPPPVKAYRNEVLQNNLFVNPVFGACCIMPVYQLPRGWGVGGKVEEEGRQSGGRVKSMQSYGLFLWFMENYFELFSCREADVICSLRTGERDLILKYSNISALLFSKMF